MLHDYETGYYHGMFGFVGADHKLKAAKYAEKSFAAFMGIEDDTENRLVCQSSEKE